MNFTEASVNFLQQPRSNAPTFSSSPGAMLQSLCKVAPRLLEQCYRAAGVNLRGIRRIVTACLLLMDYFIALL